jgi:hypothetical protein
MSITYGKNLNVSIMVLIAPHKQITKTYSNVIVIAFNKKNKVGISVNAP